MIAQFRTARRGMWANGIASETPAAYKKRHAQSELAGAVDTKQRDVEKQTMQPRTGGWFSRLWPGRSR